MPAGENLSTPRFCGPSQRPRLFHPGQRLFLLVLDFGGPLRNHGTFACGREMSVRVYKATLSRVQHPGKEGKATPRSVYPLRRASDRRFGGHVPAPAWIAPGHVKHLRAGRLWSASGVPREGTQWPGVDVASAVTERLSGAVKRDSAELTENVRPRSERRGAQTTAGSGLHDQRVARPSAGGGRGVRRIEGSSVVVVPGEGKGADVTIPARQSPTLPSLPAFFFKFNFRAEYTFYLGALGMPTKRFYPLEL
ncbi:hypothetical protein FB451DRAFT_1173220 [Mycena latifolia]|nr:hypothetical protein FB451DRAFT_1173220 [Mycena latifolia]